MAQIKLVGMSMIFYCMKLHFSEVLWLMSCFHKTKYEFKLSAALNICIFGFSQKLVLIKVVHHFKIIVCVITETSKGALCSKLGTYRKMNE
jgi:hypothetical protein